MKECFETMERLAAARSYANIFEIMCCYGDVPAAEFSQEEAIQTITYREYGEMAKKIAYALQEKGIPGGSFIGLKVDNCPQWAGVFWGMLMAGFCPLLLDAKGTKEIAMHLLGECGASAIVTDDGNLYPGYQTIALYELKAAEQPIPERNIAWADMVALCTSGTTGTAKVYVYDGEAMSNQILNTKYYLNSNKDFVYDASDGPLKNLVFLPLHHIFGFVSVYMWFSLFGKTLVYLKDKAPATILETCRRHQVTHIFCVPVFWNNMAKNILRKVRQGGPAQEKKFERACKISNDLQRASKHGRKVVASSIFKGVQSSLVGGSIRFMINGGGHLLPETQRIINAIGYPLYNGFGMTETGPISVELSTDYSMILQGSVGQPLRSVEYKVEPLGDQEGVGELKIKGSSLHTGQMIGGTLIKREEEWFSTGDIARIENGRMWIEGRLKDVIINESGENVYPDELEDYFNDLPGVEQLTVTGMHLEGEYEDIVLMLELSKGITPKEIAQLCEAISEINGALPLIKKIQRVFVAKEPLPLANGIKVQRQKVKKAVEEGTFAYQVLNLGLQKLEAQEEADQSAGTVQDVDENFAKIKQEVRAIFANVLILDESEIGDFDHFVNDLGGDSLAVIGIIAQLEEKYDVFISDEEFAHVVNLHEIAELLYEKLYGEKEDAGKQQQNQQEAPVHTGRITNFKQSQEYQAFVQRYAQMAGMEGNPYFVKHDSMIGATSIVDGREVINLGSYNYLGMSGHPETVEAAVNAVQKYGTSASGSRVLAGEKTLYQQLEQAIAHWKHAEDAIVLTGGHATNQTFIGNFCGEEDLILYDALSHNSIMQGCQLSRAKSKAFPHNDIQALEAMLKNIQGEYKKVLLVVEGVYSMDGDIAPIPEFVRLKKTYGAFLMVDEAHSSGVIGAHAGGVDDYFQLAPDDIDIKMGTLSKALGTCGGYLAGKKEIISYLKYSLPGFVFSAGISPPLAAACLKAVEIIQRDTSLADALHENIAYFVAEAKRRGFDTCRAKESAIVPVMVGEDALAFRLSGKLLQKGVFVPPAVFPAVAKGQARLRFSLTAAHTREQLARALDLLEETAKELGIKA